MKVTVNSDRGSLKAVVGAGGSGIFFEDGLGHVYYYSSLGHISLVENAHALEDLLDDETGRYPLYAGDSVTLEF